MDGRPGWKDCTKARTCEVCGKDHYRGGRETLNIPMARITANNEGYGGVSVGSYIYRGWCRNAYQNIVTGRGAGATGRGRACLARISVRHSRSGVNRIAATEELVSAIMPQVSDLADDFKRLIGREITAAALLDYHAAVAPDAEKPAAGSPDRTVNAWRRRQDEVEAARTNMAALFEQEEAAGFAPTAWLAINSATNHLQHARPVRGSDKDPEVAVYAEMPGGRIFEDTVRAIGIGRQMFA